ncbi:MAG: hypothetical protein B6D77_18305 [gamma proteobacterium symbiont of Ctena orbiculata]|nr:MAG: hypothetical protein B6D77_18305 [gamma proteobacterium symbiont of Ctena orbiculata]
MDIKQTLALALVSILTLGTLAHARNCIKGKPCGKGCIALNKTCRIDASPSSRSSTLRYSSTEQTGRIIHRMKHRLPKVHKITATSIAAVEAPNSNRTSREYKEGQRVFVYETYDTWARVSNMQPEEWLELKYLKRIGE